MEVKANDLIQWGFPQGKAFGIFLNALKNLPQLTIEECERYTRDIINDPASFLDHEIFNETANTLLIPKSEVLDLKEIGERFKVYGAAGIEQGAIEQMNVAMKLPVTVAGALMPDAHKGYGLPIGGVLATRNAVIPYGVGVDIGCRMCMSIFDLPSSIIHDSAPSLKKILLENTKFGFDSFTKPREHEVIDRPIFKELQILKTLKDRAFQQLGSSGGGNHFVEFGIIEITNHDELINLPEGKYLSLLSHSGSRGLGANIARYYTDLAMKKCKLPQEAKHLAWLDLNTEEGMEYWLAMNLAGDYASACHHQIHDRIAEALKTQALKRVENHHNFAWKEKDFNGNELIVHRKGATPAAKGVPGIIPGSMATPGYLVKGKGNSDSINSASHGAGRIMSRTQAKNTLDSKAVSAFLKEMGVELIGAGLDEAPMAYKDIRKVMEYQKELVQILGIFYPKIVRMCDDKKFEESD